MNPTHPENWTARSREERDAEIVSRLVAADEQDKALEIAQARGRRVWVADDGNAEVEYDTEQRSEAAQEYVDDGDWGDDCSETSWVTVYTYPRYYVGTTAVDDPDGRESHSIAIEAEVPDCTEGEHEWCSPHSVVGGIRENPGVWGHGAGIIVHEVCRHCGVEQVTDTWAQNRETGEQGLMGVAYHELGDEKHSCDDAWHEWRDRCVLDRAAEALREHYEARYRDGCLFVAVTDPGDESDDANEDLELIRDIVEPLGCIADFTGDGNTDRDGRSTSDVRIEVAS